MTSFAIRGLGLAGLSLLVGCKPEPVDSDTPVDDTGPTFEICDDGVDNNGDGDVDCEDLDCCAEAVCAGAPETPCDPSYYQPYAVLLEVHAGYDGQGLTGYSGLDSDGSAFVQETPWVELTFITERWDGADEREQCTWVGDITEVASRDDVVEPRQDLWVGFEVRFSLFVDEQGQPYTNCNYFPPEWGEDYSPTAVVENTRWFLGWGRGSEAWRGDLGGAVGQAGLDWDADWDPYVFAAWSGFVPPDADDFDPAYIDETGYAFGAFADEAMVLRYDESGSGIPFQPRQTDVVPWGEDVDAGAVDVDGDSVYDDLPDHVVVNNAFWGGWRTVGLLP